VLTPSDLQTITGLTDAEAAERLRRDGMNELPSARPRRLSALAIEIVRDPIFLLLAVGGTVYLVLGDVQEALMLLGFVFLIVGITLYQEWKTERALEALRDLSSPRALVIRDGRPQRIAGREVVCDDIIVLREGDRVPADAVLLHGTNLATDESFLTGESMPARKVRWDGRLAMGRPGGDGLPFVYAGTLVVQGQGVAHVRATGEQTELGKIGTALQTVEPAATPLQREMGRLVRQLAVLGSVLSALVIIAYGLTRGRWLDGLLAGIALAMAILPNEFPVVLTIFLALGAWRIARIRVLARRVPAVEALGAVTVLCVDKTGTLTRNRMAVHQLRAEGAIYKVGPAVGPLPEAFHPLVEFAILASQRDPFDPMEQALKRFAEETLAHTEHLHQDWTVVREYPLSPTLLAMSQVWRSPEGRDDIIAAKGAPEAIADLCHLDAAQQQALAGEVGMMAGEGLRVLGVARAAFQQTTLPREQHDFTFAFLGLIGLADPVRPAVPAALRECEAAGIRVAMLTGDYPATAQSIARQIGLTPLDDVLTGADVAEMSDHALQQRIRTVNIYARVLPEHKLRLVNALKANSELVAIGHHHHLASLATLRFADAITPFSPARSCRPKTPPPTRACTGHPVGSAAALAEFGARHALAWHPAPDERRTAQGRL
jgi:P-type Ca2+ transporter type 2C